MTLLARAAIAALVLVTACPAPFATAASARIAPTSATLDACHSSGGQLSRYATFGAVMRAAPVPGTATMAIRFELLERKPAASVFHPVAAPGLGVWQSSASGIGLFRATQEVAGLVAPASFRALVAFRWLAADHRILRSAHRLSPICRIPDERPNLVIGQITRPPSDGGDFTVAVRNAGLGPAGPFAVALSGGGAAERRLVPGLAAGARTTVQLPGFACATGTVLRLTTDPDDAVNETTKADNAKTIVC